MSLMPFFAPNAGTPLQLVAQTTGAVYPAMQNGDYGVLLECRSQGPESSTPPALAALSGWSTYIEIDNPFDSIGPGNNAERQYFRAHTRISLRPLTAALSGTSIGGNAQSRNLLVFRHPQGVPVTSVSIKGVETTHSFNAPINFSPQPSPILPLFAVCKVLVVSVLSQSSFGSQSYPQLLFDGAAPSLYGAASSGCIAMVGLLTGPQAPRNINVFMDAANSGGGQATRHAALNIRRS